MKAGLPPDLPHNAVQTESDPVWSLLARAPLPEPDAWFTERTMARCRREERIESVVSEFAQFPRMIRMWRWVLGGGLGVCLAMVLVTGQINSDTDDKQKNVQEAFQIMASIDTDPDSSTSPSSWQDSSL